MTAQGHNIDALPQHIQKLTGISLPDAREIGSAFRRVEVAKKENLLKEGMICTANYFVERGCLRLFFTGQNGIEHTVQFALENWWLSDYTSFSTQRASEFFIQAVEPSVVRAVSFQAQEDLLQRHPVMERYFRLIHQRVHGATQFRMKAMYDQSRKELYESFSSQFPDFVQRVPQYLLASYLGFTPEYLSQLRKRKIS